MVRVVRLVLFLFLLYLEFSDKYVVLYSPITITIATGTTRRIENWDKLSEKEKEVTWRRISKRNEERRKMLLEQMEKEEGKGEL
jgi:hypothetical protein